MDQVQEPVQRPDLDAQIAAKRQKDAAKRAADMLDAKAKNHLIRTASRQMAEITKVFELSPSENQEL